MKLVSFLMHLPGSTSHPVTVELKNGNSVNGQVLSCSPTMNLALKNIKLIQPHQDAQFLNYMNIRGNQIRQVLLPEDLNLDAVLAKCVQNTKSKGTSGSVSKGSHKPKPFKRRGV
ncbi:Sm snRNP core protein Smd1 [Yamadazyma tenuis]|uniref:Sm domain-containing protein n=1 Tax=Candida tenuis (strain ATCC 10573 / BCRC 21748 / CBS 615 / JCM 9827 / NBRC 10315 / NRRL Y-1498 / VKM Y-70) TaxID=590646 RepID=G3B9C3_CANTC|nr:uncharacterized protein CANTEDRAFT_109388 [Yamadazyma tenuis ATCC 10573]EGV62473.1 hypothetical protein CANTEDRAFT_109388 [Yamadazyma tenuis ATCC 10573]WEJ93760.1 Sm snRNP core protein Smd1 [Yamadazyma tenuis]